MTQLQAGLRLTILMTLLTGIAYPFAITGGCQLLFPFQANGSLLIRDGRTVGSRWIGQRHDRAEYFHSRPSAAGTDGYDPARSGGSNLGPSSRKLLDRIAADKAAFLRDNPAFAGLVPADLLTASGSGLDPHISPASAAAQIPRIARARNADPQEIRKLVLQFTEEPDLGFLGEPRVHVLLLNLALDHSFSRGGPR